MKGNVARQKDVDSKATTAAPYRTPGLGVVGVVAGDSKDERSVEEEEKKERERKGQEDSELVGGSARQGGRDLLFRKVSRFSPSQRAASLLCQKPKRRRRLARCVLKFVSLSSPEDQGEVEAGASGKFYVFF